MSSQISVIIPVFNAEKTLERCVESIIYGELRDISVILVDDCSGDGSWGCCRKLADRYPNVCCYQNEENRGVSYTRNHGLEKANSEYILFVDSDDWVSGQYAKKLLENAKLNPDALVICGLHFRDEVVGDRRDYIWEENGNAYYVVQQSDFFDLPEKFHLQQIWNKIFCRDVIEKAHIRFDETQNMGEDFQFVLDYMKAAQIQKCTVINEPLYYYIRRNDSSLMSNFGTIENEHEFRRLDQLRCLCGEMTSVIEQRYEAALTSTKRTYLYQMVHKIGNKAEALEGIETVMKDGRAIQHYRDQKNIQRKEHLCQTFSGIKALPGRFYGRIQREKRNRLVAEMRKSLQTKDFTLISQNCIGGVFYHDMGMQFTSPTINLYLSGKDFVAFVNNLNYYLSLKLRMTWGEEYPIGYLDDVVIFFMHYHTCREAEAAWEKRKERINWRKILVLCTDMENFTDEVYECWKQITYPKVLFTANRRYTDTPDTVFFPEYEKNGKIPDLIPDREFYRGGMLMSIVNGL